MFLYSTLLTFHSYYRWFVVFLLFFQIIWLIYHSYVDSTFRAKHLQLLLLCAFLYDVQFIAGWILYFQSTLAQQFWVDPSSMVKLRDVRFFGIEHMTMMTLCVLLINTLVWINRKKVGRKNVFSNLLKWHALLAVVVLGSIPWSFSPFTHRPNFR
jgi:hypothetical protein